MHEFRARAAQNEFRSSVRGFDLKQEASDSLSRSIIFARHLLANWHDRLRLAQVYAKVAPLATTHDPADDIPHLIFEIVVDPFLLKLSESLHDRLPRGLGRDSPKISRIHLLLEGVSQLDIGIDQAGFLQRNLRFGIAQ